MATRVPTGGKHGVSAHGPQYPQGLQLDVAVEMAQRRGFGMGKVMVGTLWGSHGGSGAQRSPSDSHVHWVTLAEEASKEPLTAMTCTANLLPASR